MDWPRRVWQIISDIDTLWSIISTSKVLMSAVMATSAGAWAYLSQWGYLPIALTVLGVFTCTVWLWNGVVWARGRNVSNQLEGAPTASNQRIQGLIQERDRLTEQISPHERTAAQSAPYEAHHPPHRRGDLDGEGDLSGQAAGRPGVILSPVWDRPGPSRPERPLPMAPSSSAARNSRGHQFSDILGTIRSWHTRVY
jgi:hypothetical protein